MFDRYRIPKVKESKSLQFLTTIWLVPIIALIIALWLGYQYYSQIGALVKVHFKSNAGLVANQSPVKFRDVTVGMVERIELEEDGNGVILSVRMDKEMSKFLNHEAKFWIVYPNIDSAGISGLDTLISGSYLKFHGKKISSSQKEFKGLEKPYIDNELKGKSYTLSSPESNDIVVGSNVYFRKMKIGRVESVEIDKNGQKVNFKLFVEEKYTTFINNKSMFYTRSNFAFDFSQGKLNFNIAPLSQIVHGGISIYTPADSIGNSMISKTKVFPLYASLADMQSKNFSHSEKNAIYRFDFNESITKLAIGSPVQFNGFQIGYVTNIESPFNPHQKGASVYTLINTEWFENNQTQQNGKEVIASLVQMDGLKASLNASIVGNDFVDLVFEPNGMGEVVDFKTFVLLPTTKRQEGSKIMVEAEKLVVKLNALPLEELLETISRTVDNNNEPTKNLLLSLDKSVQNFGVVLENINKMTTDKDIQKMPKELNKTLIELQHTLKDTQKLVDIEDNKPLNDKLTATLKELSDVAISLQKVTNKLDKKPNALVVGD